MWVSVNFKGYTKQAVGRGYYGIGSDRKGLPSLHNGADREGLGRTDNHLFSLCVFFKLSVLESTDI